MYSNIINKILFFLTSFIFTINIILGQDAADKKFHAGLVMGVGMNFQKMGTKLIDKNGMGMDRFVGGNLVYMLNETIGLLSGVEFEFSTSRFMSGNNLVYYYYNDSKIVAKDNKGDAKNIFRLSERKQRATYLTIPTVLVFKTDYIGYIRYFGKFGLRHGFLLGQKSNDIGETTDITDEEFKKSQNYSRVEQKDMKASNEMLFYKGSVTLSAGIDWNFMGGTCLVVEIGYNYGITPLFYNRKNSYFYSYEKNGDRLDFSNKATQGALHLKASLLF